MGEYYAVQRSDDYLAHYGVKGMKWGVRRALKARTKGQRSAKLQKQYLKASNRLAKLKNRENVELQKSDAQKYGKIAKKALGLAGAGTKAGLSKRRTTPKGHSKAVANRKNWEKQMKSAFKGTKYASLPNAGPILAGQARKRQKRLENLKQDTKDALVAGALGALVGPYANIAVTSRRAAIGDGRSLITGKKNKKKKRS